MTERGVLFSDPLVRQILAGRKTVTRRIVTPQPKSDHLGEFNWPSRLAMSMVTLDEMPALSPYRCKRLWVREAWRAIEQPDGTDGVLYRSDGEFLRIAATAEAADAWVVAYDNGKHGDHWRPSIFMPRWAARILLDVLSVRVERLHEIDDTDAVREGVVAGRIPATGDHPESIGYVLGDDDKKCTLYPTEREAFAAGWDKINGDRAPWSSNPFVWRVGFRRSSPGIVSGTRVVS